MDDIKLFENWFKSTKWFTGYNCTPKYITYRSMLQAWQASTQRQGYKLVPVDDTNIMDMIYGKCPCGSSRSPIISDKEGYSLIHCFSCGANKYIHEDY